MATIAVAELVRVLARPSRSSSAARRASAARPCRAPCSTSPSSRRCRTTTSSSPCWPFLLGLTWWIERSRMGFYLRAIKDSERAARSLGVSAGRYKLYAYMLSGALTALAGSLYLCMFGFVDPEVGLRHPDLGQDADHGGARRRGPAVRAAGRRADPGAARGDLEQPARRPRRRPHLRGLRRHHRDHRPLPAERPAVAVRAPSGQACAQVRAASGHAA